MQKATRDIVLFRIDDKIIRTFGGEKKMLHQLQIKWQPRSKSSTFVILSDLYFDYFQDTFGSKGPTLYLVFPVIVISNVYLLVPSKATG